MLSVYTNQQDLLKATSTAQVTRLETVDSELLDVRNFAVTFNKGYRPNLELHVYTPDGAYLTGNHKTLYSIEKNDTTSQKVAYEHIAVNAVEELNSIGITRGQYRIVYNLFDNVLGGFDKQKLFIKEISPSRRELRIQLANAGNELVQQLVALKQRWNQLGTNDIFDSFVINFGFNETYQIINFRFEGTEGDIPEFFIRLYEPLPSKYGEKSKIWISEEVINPIVEYVSVIPTQVEEPVQRLAGPNFELEGVDGGSISTDFKSWNDLLAANTSTSQQLIDSYFSGSLAGIKLNINYRNFANFIHYGSASERVQNFKYKMQLIENFSNQIHFIINSINDNGDIVQVNLDDFITKRNAIVSGFDDFEKYLFFESEDSKLYTHYDNSTGSISPWPKKDAAAITWQEASIKWSNVVNNWVINASPIIDPYDYFAKQYETYASIAETYYDDLLELAEIYDKQNVHALKNTVALHIQNSSDGEEFLLFVNMISQHFDILWTYINNLTSVKTREEHPSDGMPNDLLYHVANSMGFSLLNGKSTSELWKYSLGVDDTGTALQDGTTNGVTSISDESNTKEVWRRIINNLPYILKSKGTSRSIKALLACFGIPSTVLTIKEYGGPSTFTDNDHYPEYIHDKYHYAWLSTTGSIAYPVTSLLNGIKKQVAPNTLEFRFKTDNNFTYAVNQHYSICDISSGSIPSVYQLTIRKETADDNEGTVTLINTVTGTAISASNLEIFDNSWHSVAIEGANNTGSLKIAKSLYGNEIYIRSASYNGTNLNIFANSITGSGNYINFSSGSKSGLSGPAAIVEKFNGHYHEIRLWSGSLNNNTLNEHAASPGTYTYNVNRAALTTGEEASAPYDRLLQRFTLANKQITGSGASLVQYSAHPNQRYNTSNSIIYSGYANSGSIKFEAFEETYYTPSPSLGGSSLYSNKVRIESSSLEAGRRLNTKTRIEKSSFDRYSLDSNKVGVYFSPQTAINDDIFNQLGYFEIDDYIGDPSDIYNDSYTALSNFATQYWKKYENRNDFEAYFRALEIYDFTLFKYIKQMLPQRANPMLGLVVEPNVLERSRARVTRKPTIEDLTKYAFIDETENKLEAEYELHEGLIEEYIVPPIVDYDAKKEGIIDDLLLIPFSEFDVEKEATIPELTLNATSEFDSDKEGLIDERGYNTTSDYLSRYLGAIDVGTEIETLATYNSFGGAIEGELDSIDKLGTNWVQHRYIGIYKITESGSYTPLQTTIFDSSINSNYYTEEYYYSSAKSASLNLPYSSSLTPYAVNLNHGLGWYNARYAGCKLTGTAINANSNATVDGGPVVRVTKVNPNRIVFANNQITTIDEAVIGIKKKSI
jgi:hypothetical protein